MGSRREAASGLRRSPGPLASAAAAAKIDSSPHPELPSKLHEWKCIKDRCGSCGAGPVLWFRVAQGSTTASEKVSGGWTDSSGTFLSPITDFITSRSLSTDLALKVGAS